MNRLPVRFLFVVMVIACCVQLSTGSSALVLAQEVPDSSPDSVNTQLPPLETVSMEGCDADLGPLHEITSAAIDSISGIEQSEVIWQVHSICRKNRWAYAYLKGFDSDSLEPIPSPSKVILARRVNDDWQIATPTNPELYNTWLDKIPTSVLDGSLREILYQSMGIQTILNYSGYYLPFPNGDGANAYKHNEAPQVDFGILGPNSIGTVRNSKGGTVVFVKDSSTRECGDPPPDGSCWQWANSIVLRISSNEYAWYMHFAPNSIPDWIQEGVYVPAGTDLGQEGKTGWASGPHVHFMVANNYACCWGSGDSRIPHWPDGNPSSDGATSPVDFVEKSWSQLSGWVVSQNNGSTGSNCPNVTYNGVILYTDKDCRGNSKQYGGSTSWINISDFNDVTSSIYVKSGWSVRVYEHANNDQNGGKNRCITGSMWDLDKDYYPDSSTKINDTISSIRVFINGSCTDGDPVPTKPIQLYKDASYGGGVYCYVESAGMVSNIDGCEGFNDAISSLLLKSGWSAWVFEHQNFGGGKKCYTGSDPDLSNDQFDNGLNANDKISSFALYNSSSCPAWEIAPPKPSLSSPSNGATLVEGEAINLSWNSSSGATGYYGEITGGPSPLSFDWQSGTSKNIGAQWPGYEYSWRVKARNGAGESPYSDTWKFKVIPKAPTNTSASALSCTSVKVTWADNSASEDGYKIYRGGTEVGSVGAGATSFTDGVSKQTSYTYTVKAHRNGFFSNAGSASVTTPDCPVQPPQPPVRIAPPYGKVFVEGEAITLSWENTATATGYFGEVTGGPSDMTFGWQTDTSVNLGAQWPGYDYLWRVKAKNSGGESAYTDKWKFTVIPKAPSNTSTSELTCNSVKVSWTNNSNSVDGFRIYRNGSEAGYVSAGITSFTDQGLQAQATYDYTVRAVRNGITSDASNTASATLSSCTPSVPSDFRVTGTTEDTVSLAWSDTANETGYKLYRWDELDGDWDFYFYGTLSANVTAFTDTDLNCGAHYFYEISAFNGSGESAHTGWIDGVTTACLSDVPTLVAPADGAVLNQSDSITLSWNEAEHAYDYFAEIWSADNGFPWDSGWTAETSWSVGRLDSGTYYWHVLSGNGAGGMSAWSETRSFTVEETPICQPGQNGIVLYQEANYTGRCVTLTGDTDDLTAVSFNDVVSSIQFVGAYANAGWQISLFANGGFVGPFSNLRFDDPDLSNNNPVRGDQVSSIRIWQDSDDGRMVTLNQPASGTVHVASDLDWYRFQGTAGQTVTITMDGQGGALDPYLVLYGPAWAKLAFDDNSGGNANARILNYRLWTTGTYHIFAQSFSGGSAGAYQIKVTDAQCVPGANGIVLYAGVNYTGSCITLTADEQHLGSRGFNDTVSSLRFVGNYAISSHQISLFADSNFSGAVANFFMDDPDLGNNIGNRIASSFRIWQDGDDGRQISWWQTLYGTIDVPSDFDTYWFYGTVGQHVTIRMNKEGAGLDPYLTLFGPQWGVLKQDDDSGGGDDALIYDFRLWTTGTYRIYARSFDRSSSGSYHIYLTPGP